MTDPTNNERVTEEAGAELIETNAPETQRDPLAALRAGTIIEGKHRVDRIIGRGGMGVVAAATHIHLNERVALKFLLIKDEEVSGDFRARFEREARVCAKLRNEHIARVHDVGIWESRVPFMVMEYLEGVDLRRLLRDGAKLPIEQAVEYVVQICDGLAEAHAQGIVHRDLKPPNIFITRRPDGTELVKVLDFGISKWTTPDDEVGELTKTGVMLGSPKYMSPEQLNGGAIDARADIWSIGAILYQMLTGRPPFDYLQVTQTFMAIASGVIPALPSTLEPSIPATLDAVILRCLTRDKDLRIQNVAQLAGAVLEAIDSPFSGQARQQIGAVLDPSGAASNRAGPLSITTGSHAVFSLGSSGVIQLSDVIAPVDPALLAGAKKSRLDAKTWLVAGVGIAALAFVALARTPHVNDGVGTASGAASHEKTPVLKQLASDHVTTLAREPSAAAPIAPSPASRAVYEAPRRSARAASPSAVAPVVASPAAASAPAPAPKPLSTANALDDRQ
jgi:serine/threonine protein kinase